MFERYAIYYTFEGVLDALGAAWLGWDIASGTDVSQPKLGALDLAKVTKRPRKYGFHATIKAPFYLAQGARLADLEGAFETLCATTTPAKVDALKVTQLGRMFALVPSGEDTSLKTLAQTVVETLSPLRAPLTPDDLKRRAKPNLSARQIENLRTWGYPHVMEDFRFHVTLTGPLDETYLPLMKDAAEVYFTPHLPAPFTLNHLTLAGARADGLFRELRRDALTG